MDSPGLVPRHPLLCGTVIQARFFLAAIRWTPNVESLMESGGDEFMCVWCKPVE
jgi:hypothetical protein